MRVFSPVVVIMISKAILSVVAISTLFAGPEPTVSPSAPRTVEAANPKIVTYTIDPVHSELSFRVRHLLGRVRGTFNEWNGTVKVDPSDLSTGSVEVKINVGTVDTKNGQRDEHLRSGDFFAADKFPEMTFRSRQVVVKGKALKIHGDLTLRGVTKPVVLEGAYLGQTTDPWGKERLAFEASTTINRQDFGVSWNNVVEGSAMVGDEVTIDIVLQVVRS